MPCEKCKNARRADEMTLVRNPYSRHRTRPENQVVICVIAQEAAGILRLILETGDHGQLRRKLTALAQGLEKEHGMRKLQQIVTTTN